TEPITNYSPYPMVAHSQSPHSPSRRESPEIPAPTQDSRTQDSGLSARDSALLSSLIRSNFDLLAVSFDHGLSIPHLCAWLQSPAIQTLAADLLRSTHIFLEIRVARARMNLVGILETVAQTSDDPIERRRAAAAVFRRFSTQLPTLLPPPPRHF